MSRNMQCNPYRHKGELSYQPLSNSMSNSISMYNIEKLKNNKSKPEELLVITSNQHSNKK